jgi:hypothetical protein
MHNFCGEFREKKKENRGEFVKDRVFCKNGVT